MQPEKLIEVVQDNIWHYRKLSGLSQSKLAEMCGTTQDHISKLESGVVSPTVAMLGRLSEALGVEPKILVSEPPPTDGLKARRQKRSKKMETVP